MNDSLCFIAARIRQPRGDPVQGTYSLKSSRNMSDVERRSRSLRAVASVISETSAKLGLREQNKLDKRQRIRAAARELFSKHGYEAATLRQIAKRAHVGLG